MSSMMSFRFTLMAFDSLDDLVMTCAISSRCVLDRWVIHGSRSPDGPSKL